MILDINQKQNLRFIMLILKDMTSNLHYVSDLKSAITAIPQEPILKEIKNVTTLTALKTKIKRWKPIGLCRIVCKIYI